VEWREAFKSSEVQELRNSQARASAAGSVARALACAVFGLLFAVAGEGAGVKAEALPPHSKKKSPASEGSRYKESELAT
jgi:hypothetical protein